MLSAQYNLTVKTEDLEEAINNARREVDIAPRGYSDLASKLSNLGNKLSGRYNRTGKTEDLDDAISNTRRAVDVSPKGHPHLAI
jgi:hypothetical protein